MTRYQPDRHLNGDGYAMRIPAEFVTTISGDGYEISLECTVDGHVRPGHGRGFAMPFTFEAEVNGTAESGSAYLEWVDLTA